MFPSHKTLVIHIIENSRFPISGTSHAYPDVRGNPVSRCFSPGGSIDRFLESSPGGTQYLRVGISGIRYAKTGQCSRGITTIHRVIIHDMLISRRNNEIHVIHIPRFICLERFLVQFIRSLFRHHVDHVIRIRQSGWIETDPSRVFHLRESQGCQHIVSRNNPFRRDHRNHIHTHPFLFTLVTQHHPSLVSRGRHFNIKSGRRLHPRTLVCHGKPPDIRVGRKSRQRVQI